MSEVYLQHHGVKGMKWGVRKVRGHAGPGVYANKRRQLAGDKRDLNTLNKGGHLSVGLTKKRQEALDNRDKAALEKRVAKNEKHVAGPSARELKRINKKLHKFGPAQNVVLNKVNTDRLRDKEFYQKWDAAFKAGKGSKEWAAYEKYANDFRDKYKDQYVDAWLKDNNVRRISEEGRQYVSDNYFKKE